MDVKINVKESISLPIEKLKPFQGELKKLSEENFNKLRNEILDDGFNFAFHVWKSDNCYFILDGHQRHYVLTQLKKQGYNIDLVPCNVVEADDIESAKRKVLQAVSQYGKLTNEGYLEFTHDLNLDFTNFDLPDFTPPDLPQLEIDNEPNEKDDEIPEVEDNPYGVERGDVWQLGNHRLMCGDSTSEDDVNKLMAGEKADITFTSPPYNAGKTPKEQGKYLNDDDDKSSNEYRTFLNKFIKIALSVSDYVFSNIQSISGNKIPLIEHIYDLRDKYADVIIWDKGSAQPAMARRVLNSRFEYIYIFSNEANRAIGKRDFRGTIDNIFALNSRAGKEFAKIHKATFRVELPQKFLTDFSETSAYEPFCGTGSTLIACEKTNRKCYGMEIDPHYVSVIIKRWEDYTGQKAVKT
jgi:DNA modification methylase